MIGVFPSSGPAAHYDRPREDSQSDGDGICFIESSLQIPVEFSSYEVHSVDNSASTSTFSNDVKILIITGDGGELRDLVCVPLSEAGYETRGGADAND